MTRLGNTQGPQPAISGTTRLIAVIADPVEHLVTPGQLNAVLARRGQDVVTVPMHVGAEGLAHCLKGLAASRNVIGAVVTLPHKIDVVPLCATLGQEAQLAGAVNVLRWGADRLCRGELFDGLGMVRGFLQEGIDPRQHHVLLLGAGGAARAIAFALARQGVRSLGISNRDQEKAARLVRALGAAFPDLTVDMVANDVSGRSLVVNATSLGLKPDDPLPVEPERLDSRAIVAEVVMKPARTRLLIAAEAAGCRTHPGIHMLDGQINAIADFLLGQEVGNEVK